MTKPSKPESKVKLIYSVTIRQNGCLNFYEIEAKNDREATKLFNTLVDEKTDKKPAYSELLIDGKIVFFNHRLL